MLILHLGVNLLAFSSSLMVGFIVVLTILSTVLILMVGSSWSSLNELLRLYMDRLRSANAALRLLSKGDGGATLVVAGVICLAT